MKEARPWGRLSHANAKLRAPYERAPPRLASFPPPINAHTGLIVAQFPDTDLSERRLCLTVP
jgi:hypothetical protein